jgi:hypothetical protein
MPRKKDEERQYMIAKAERFYMPGTQQQGWGQISGPTTSVTEVDNGDGSRTITRTGI